MLEFNSEIKRLNLWEKILQVSNEVGYTSPSIVEAKLAIAKAMTKYGLVLTQRDKNTFVLVNAHHFEEQIGVFGDNKTDVLLDTFSVVIVENVVVTQEKKVVNPSIKPVEVVNTNEVVGTNNVTNGTISNNEIRQMCDYLSKHMENYNDGKQVYKARVNVLFGRQRELGWDKNELKRAILQMTGKNEENITNSQFDVIADYMQELIDKKKEQG